MAIVVNETRTRQVRFRCATGPGVGLGHVSRCLGLAELFEDAAGVRPGFVVSSSSARAMALIRGAGFSCTKRRGDDLPHDADGLAGPLHDNDIVIIDDYGLTRDYVRRLKRNVACRVLVVDDMTRWNTGLVDWVLALPTGSSSDSYGKTRAFCGPEYLPLRRAFRTARTRVVTDGDVCLIVLGGRATPSLMRWAVEGASRSFSRLRVAFTSSAGKRLPSVQSSCRVELLPPLPDLAAEIARSSACVCTGGLTKYECVALETPAVVIDQPGLEHRDTLRLQRSGMLAGVVPAMDSQKLAAALSDLRSRPLRLALQERLHDAGIGRGVTGMVAEILRRTW